MKFKKDGPAYSAGIKSGDMIISINDNKITSVLDVSTFINTSSKENIIVRVLRNEMELDFKLSPKMIESKDSLGNKINKKIIGINVTPPKNELNKKKLGPATAIFYAIKETWFVTRSSLEFVISLFKGQGDTNQLGGPIKIAKITGQVAQLGMIAFLSITAYISISLGFINLFPIPMLDGGHLMFYAFEKVLGRPLTQKTQESFFRIGLFLLIFLMLFTTINDLKDIGLF